MQEAYHKLQSKPKKSPELKDALQRIWTVLLQKSIVGAKGVKDFRKWLKDCVSANGEHFDV